MNADSHVIKMVHVKPRIDTKPKLRYEGQLRTIFLETRTAMTPLRLAAFPIERARLAAAHGCLGRMSSRNYSLGARNHQLHEPFEVPSRSYL